MTKNLETMFNENLNRINSDFRIITDFEELKTKTFEILDFLNNNPNYIAGFVDGEGCFSCSMNNRTDMTLGFQIIPEFNVIQSEIDVAILLAFCLFFKAGFVKNNRGKDDTKDSVRFTYCVRNLKDLNKLVIFFTKNSLQSKRKRELLTFKSIIDKMISQDHLTIKGLYEIALLMQTLFKRKPTAKFEQNLESIKIKYEASIKKK